jgi:hypothetical protein
MTDLCNETLTFGKYKNYTLITVLRDRSYCSWVLKQEWFQTNYEYLYNRIKEYDPKKYFLIIVPDTSTDFLDSYQYFNLISVENIELKLTVNEKKCYSYYLEMIADLKNKIIVRVNEDNPYDIKAPVRWLKKFEKDVCLSRIIFKEFLYAYELPNIPYIVEDIKKEGGIEYKGAQSFNIAKKRSEEQELWWGVILKEKYGEDIGTQFKFEKCIFDFINISLGIIFECKLGLKDFDTPQYDKYKKTLGKFRIVYLIGYDGIIDIKEEIIYTLDTDKYERYQMDILTGKNTGKIDELIKDYTIIQVTNLKDFI